MTTYKEIFGKQIKNLSSDPPAAISEGQIWYNTTSGTFKSTVGISSWSSGGTLNSPSYGGGAAGSAMTSMLAFGGATGPSNANSAKTQSYNGSNWSSEEDLPAAQAYNAGCGTEPAALSFNSAGTFEYDGTNWATNPNNISPAINEVSGFGIQTAAIRVGGWGPTAGTNYSQSYDGSSWTNTPGTLYAPTAGGASCGTSTAGVAFGGYGGPSNPNYINTIQDFNGSTWTAGAANLPAVNGGLGCAGSSTNAIIFGGSPGSATTFTWNGTSIGSNPSMSAGANHVANGGQIAPSAGFALRIGGATTKTVSEEFDLVSTVRTLTSS